MKFKKSLWTSTIILFLILTFAGAVQGKVKSLDHNIAFNNTLNESMFSFEDNNVQMFVYDDKSKLIKDKSMEIIGENSTLTIKNAKVTKVKGDGIKYGFKFKKAQDEVKILYASNKPIISEEFGFKILVKESIKGFGNDKYTEYHWLNYDFSDLINKNPNATITLTKTNDYTYIVNTINVTDYDPSITETYTTLLTGDYQDTEWLSTDERIQLERDALFIGKFDINYSGNTYYDDSAYKNDGTWSHYHTDVAEDGHAAWQSNAACGNGLKMIDSDENYIDVDNTNNDFDFGTSTDFSVAFWMKSTGDGSYRLFSTASLSPVGGWNVDMTSLKPRFFGRSGNAAEYLSTSNTAITNNTWTHIVVNVDRDLNVSFFVDSVETAFTLGGTNNASALVNDFDSPKNLEIGKITTGTTGMAHAEFSSIKVFNRTLTQSEIDNMYGNESTCQYDEVIDASTDLVLYLPLNDSETGIADDFSVPDNDGALKNYSRPEQEAGVYNLGLFCDGTDDKITLSISSARSNTMTVCSWFSIEDNTVANMSLVSSGDTSAFASTNWNLQVDGDEVRFDGDSANLSTSGAGISVDTNTHVCAKNNGTHSFIYVDGVELVNASHNVNNGNGAGEFICGNSWGVDERAYFSGNIDDVFIWNRSLSASEVSTVYTSPDDYVPRVKLNGNYTSNFIVLGYKANITEFNVSGLYSNDSTNINRDDTDANLISWFTFDNTFLDTKGIDSVTNYGSQYGMLGINGSQYLDGADDYLETTTIDLGNNFTVSVWARHDLYDYGDVLSSTTTNTFSLISYADGHTNFGIGNGSWGTSIVSAAGILNDRDWNHLVATYNSTHTEFWVNGVSVGSQANAGYDINKAFAIGKRAPTNYYFNGWIDELKFYNRTLSGDEIREDYMLARAGDVSVELRTCHDYGTTCNAYTLFEVDDIANGVFNWDSGLGRDRLLQYRPAFTTFDYEFATYITNITFAYSSNNVPVTSAGSFASDSGNDWSNDNLVFTIISDDLSDDDSDVIKPIFNWLLDDVSVVIGNYPFEGKQGNESLAFKDYSGNENNGTVSGATWNITGGWDGNGSYSCDGTNDHLVVSDNAALDGISREVSVELWVKPKTGSSGSIIRKHIPAGNDGFYMILTSDYFRFAVNDYGWQASEWVGSGGAATYNAWNHVVGTYDGQERRIYVNGDLADYEYRTGTVTANNDDLYFCQRGDSQEYFNGSIDEVRIWNRSLSPEYVKELYENNTHIMDFEETRGGDVWENCVVPNDGYEDGVENCSGTITVYDIALDNVLINSTTGLNDTTENVTAYYDTANGSTNGIIDFRVNGSSMAVLNMPFENWGDNETHYYGSMVKDYTIYEHNGTVTEAKWNGTTGHDGNGSFYFDGSDYISVTSTDDLNFSTGSFTVMAWAKTTAKTTGRIVNKGDAVGTPSAYGWGITPRSDGSVWFIAAFGGTEVIHKNATDVYNTNWKHYVMVVDRDNGELQGYIDGVAVTTATDISSYEGNTSDTSRDLTIGTYRRHTDNALGEYFTGYIDDVLVFDRALDLNQIKEIYENGYETIVSNELNNGEEWEACITPNDGFEDGTPICTGNMTIQATVIPDVTSTVLNSSSLTNYTDENLTCYATVVDYGNASVYVNYTWYVDNTANLSGQISGVTNNTLSLIHTLPTADTNKNEDWICSIRAWDGENYDSVWTNTTALTVLNSVPVGLTLSFASDTSVNLSTENLTVSGSVSDSDDDDVKIIYNYYLNGTSLQILNYAFEDWGENSTHNASDLAKDYSGYELNGSVTNAIFSSTGGHDGNGTFFFDGAGDYIDTGSYFNNMVDNFTITFWINPDPTQIIYSSIFGHHDNNQGMTVQQDASNNNLYSWYVGTGSGFDASGNFQLTADVWQLVTLKKNSTHCTAYVNETQIVSGSCANPMTISTVRNYWIGQAYSDDENARYFEGYISNFVMWNVTLSDVQISALVGGDDNLIVSEETSLDDRWHVCVTPNDGEVDGAESCSENVTVWDVEFTENLTDVIDNTTDFTMEVFDSTGVEIGRYQIIYFNKTANAWQSTPIEFETDLQFAYNFSTMLNTTNLTFNVTANQSLEKLSDTKLGYNDGTDSKEFASLSYTRTKYKNYNYVDWIAKSDVAFNASLTFTNYTGGDGLTYFEIEALNITDYDPVITDSFTGDPGGNSTNTTWESAKNVLRAEDDAVYCDIFEMNLSQIDYCNNEVENTYYDMIYNATGGHGGSGGYEFNGSNYISLDNSNDVFDFGTDTNFSVAFWINLENDGVASDRILSSSGTLAGKWYGWTIDFTSAKPRFFVTSGGAGKYIATADNTIAYNAWNHVVLNFDRTDKMSMYVNGSNVSVTHLNTDNVSENVNSTRDMQIGRVLAQTNNMLNGSLDNLYIFDKFLTEDEIVKLYNGSNNGTSYLPVHKETGHWIRGLLNLTNNSIMSTANITMNGSFNNGTTLNRDTTASIESGLVSWHTLDGDSKDLMGLHDGTDLGIVYDVRGVNGSAEFNRSTDRISPANAYSFNNEFSASIWFKVDLYNYVDLLSSSTKVNRLTFVTYADGHMSFAMGNGTWSNNVVSSAGSIQDNEWTHVFGTWNGTNISLWINGELIGRNSMPQSYVDINDTFSIGQRQGGSYNFDGFIDEVKIYNVSKTDAEVLEIYRKSRPNRVHVDVRSCNVDNTSCSDWYSNVNVDLGTGRMPMNTSVPNNWMIDYKVYFENAEDTQFSGELTEITISSANVTNTAPQMINITNPTNGSTHYTNYDLVVVWNGNDTDNDTIQYYVEWSTTGGINYTTVTTTNNSNVTLDLALRDPGLTSVLRITPYDGTENGTGLYTGNFSLLESTVSYGGVSTGGGGGGGSVYNPPVGNVSIDLKVKGLRTYYVLGEMVEGNIVTNGSVGWIEGNLSSDSGYKNSFRLSRLNETLWYFRLNSTGLGVGEYTIGFGSDLGGSVSEKFFVSGNKFLNSLKNLGSDVLSNRFVVLSVLGVLAAIILITAIVFVFFRGGGKK